MGLLAYWNGWAIALSGTTTLFPYASITFVGCAIGTS
jgi:hypothetical protein